MRVTVFGLGEAGSVIAADIARTGAEVHGYDPADVVVPALVTRSDSPESAVQGSSLIISATAASDATEAMDQAWHDIEPEAIYADMATASPGLKRELGDRAAARRIRFADVALMAPVPGKGLSTPSLASGPGALAYAETINPMGGQVEVLGDLPGDAAARKLLRSVITKGLASLLIESLEAARARGEMRWMWDHIVNLMAETDETFLRRLLIGTGQHVDRRIVEMEAALEFLHELKVPATMTESTVDSLRRVRSDGTPGLE